MNKENKEQNMDNVQTFWAHLKAAHELLVKEYDPHTRVEITYDKITVLREEEGLPAIEAPILPKPIDYPYDQPF